MADNDGYNQHNDMNEYNEQGNNDHNDKENYSMNEQGLMDQDEHQKEMNGSGDSSGKRETVNTTKRDDDERKLFIGGISWETTESDLKTYLAKYGNVVDINIKTDPHTGKSRGFGFVLFDSVQGVDNVLIATGPHVVNGKQIDPKRAKSRPGRELLRKVFIGGMDPATTEEEIRNVFVKYGAIEKIEQPFDKVRNQKRNFCFLTFDSPDIVQDICKNSKILIKGKECDVKKATPSNKNANQPPQMTYNQQNPPWNPYSAYYQGYANYGNYDYGGYYPNANFDYYQGYYGQPQVPPAPLAHQGNGGKAKRGASGHASNYHPYSQ
ncbi:unnamed protein product [Gordionus sp. m RMFG-2023]